jgi:hypothetical protein
MDYKYIEQLLERYWECATTLEEEQILRTFFSQKDVPVVLLPYKDLFTYTETEKTETVLGDDFDARILSMIEDPAPVKAKTIRLTQRLKPLFKAAAVVAIFLTLGNAMQVAFQPRNPVDTTDMASVEQMKEGVSVAQQVDTAKQDSSKLQTSVQLYR